MKKQNLALLFFLLILFPACRRKSENLSLIQEESPAIASQQDSLRYESQFDTAEVTQLRIFARKRITIFSPKLLVGEWKLKDWHMELDSNGIGKRWNMQDLDSENEVELFQWSLDSNILSFEFSMVLGGVIPKMYLLTFVDNESLVYCNVFGDSFMWNRLK